MKNKSLFIGLFSALMLASCTPKVVDVIKVDEKPDIKDIIKIEDEEDYTISVAIKGASEVKSGKDITLKSVVSGHKQDDGVIWSIDGEGAKVATIDENGKLTASDVATSTMITVTATSKENSKYKASKVVTILSKAQLTQTMLNKLDVETIGFEGYETINLYEITGSQSLQASYNTLVRTSMDGTNWFAQYNDTTGLSNTLYYKNVSGNACQIGVSFMNDEVYEPMLDDFDKVVTFEKSGLYNSLRGLTTADFRFNEDTWMWEYTGSLDTIKKITASANPYDFTPINLSLIVDDDEILGLRSQAKEDYKIVEGYKALCELTVAINTNTTVSVPTVGKYSHEDIHDDLNAAIANMHALESYTCDYREITKSIYSSSYDQHGLIEKITPTEAQMIPYTVKYNTTGEEVEIADKDYYYGFKKINDNLYNAYFADSSDNWKVKASRAYDRPFTDCLPSFAFAGEIFRSYYDNEDGSRTYYVDEIMNQVATTFYYGMGTDVNLYGIYASTGYTSDTDSFTPYVTVKDGYITEAGFYFNMYYIYGIIELSFYDFNKTNSVDKPTTFTTRNVPSTWDEVTMYYSEDSASTTEDVEMNAAEGLKKYFEDDSITSKIPFLGVSECLGDTYGFALTTQKQGADGIYHKAIICYFDVYLDIDYSIESSLKAIRTYLTKLGFTNRGNDEFVKDGVVVHPADENLDLMVYVWLEK